MHSIVGHKSMGTYPARAIIWCHADSCPSSPPESNNVSSNGIFPCPSVVRIMGVFYRSWIPELCLQKKPLFEMDCLAHVISGSCKDGVVDVQSEDGLLDTPITRAKINKAIIWTKKSQKGAVALIQA